MKYNKVCIYAICKNEQLYIKKWLESLLEADYIVIDGKGVGAGIVDLLLDDVYDTDTGETYGVANGVGTGLIYIVKSRM